MKKLGSIFRCLLIATIWVGNIGLLCATDTSTITLIGKKSNWQADINKNNGIITEYRHYSDSTCKIIYFRNDAHAGPSWENIELHPSNDPFTFESLVDSIYYAIQYIMEEDHLIVKCKLANRSDRSITKKRIRLILGVDSEMKTFPDWDDKHFPTLLRCEKDFAWGYFMSPKQSILGIAIAEPVASYALNYIYEGRMDWKWGHQIKTASLDLLHQGPLPQRHPQHLETLEVGEEKTWTIHLGVIPTLEDIKPLITKWVDVPLIECDRYSVMEGEEITLKVNSQTMPSSISVVYPDGEVLELKPIEYAQCIYSSKFTLPNIKGIYKIEVETLCGKKAEACVSVLNPWSWYMKNARDFVAKYPPIFSNSCETFYGYYTAFLASRHFPDSQDRALEDRFNRTLNQFIDTVNWTPNEACQPDRVQNFSSLIGMLVDLWESTGNLAYLEKASKVADYLCTERIQADDGSYRSKGVHYTAVIYPAKSMLELAAAEKQFENDPIWKERYDRHKDSAYRAIEDLLERRDDIQTEGDMTFEDGMISCSALQLALRALLEQDDMKLKQAYTDAAAYLMNKHNCLEQNIIPDSRMRGGTLRYWEALDIYFVPNQAMSSPHGWTAWKIYASYYLYLLTGEKQYLYGFMNTLGACAQIMDWKGNLRWAFVTDPYIEGKICSSIEGKKINYTDITVGEQYLDMISPWLRPEEDDKVCFFGETGGAGDNTVQEIFKAMEECALTTAYVLVDKNGNIESWNCKALYSDGALHVYPYEAIIKTIHVNLPQTIDVITYFENKTISETHHKGMNWIGKMPYLFN